MAPIMEMSQGVSSRTANIAIVIVNHNYSDETDQIMKLQMTLVPILSTMIYQILR